MKKYNPVTKLSAGRVVERSHIAGMSVRQLQEFVDDLMFTHVVESARKFFSDENLMSAINTADIRSIKLIAEERGIELTAVDQEAINAHVAWKKRFIERFCTVKTSYDKYPFAPVPGGWNIETAYIVASGDYVRRKKPDGTFTQWNIRMSQLQDIWNRASVYWIDVDRIPNPQPKAFTKTIDNYRRRCQIAGNGVNIGCQSVARYELEQLAKQQGWEFP